MLDLPAPGKTAALNAGDAAARGFPRLYLDADVVISAADVRTLVAALRPGPREDGPLAVMPRRRLDLAGRPMLVRAFFAINARLPVYRDALFGRGLIVLSEQGRARFDAFPQVIADDLFLDSLFASAEKVQVDAVTTTIATPRRTRDLVRRLVRVRAGNAAMRAAASAGEAPSGVRASARSSWLRDVVVPRPWLAPAAVCYVAITLTAAVAARRSGPGGPAWGHDESSRVRVGD